MTRKRVCVENDQNERKGSLLIKVSNCTRCCLPEHNPVTVAYLVTKLRVGIASDIVDTNVPF